MTDITYRPMTEWETAEWHAGRISFDVARETDHGPEVGITRCAACGKSLTRDNHGTLVDSTGGDVCGSYGTFGNEPHILACTASAEDIAEVKTREGNENA